MKFDQRLILAGCLATAVANLAMAAEPAAVVAPRAGSGIQASSAPAPSVLIGTGDQVSIDVFGNPDLSTITSVSEDGTIRMPLAGTVTVAGQSTIEAARRIEAALIAGEYLVNPQVTVGVVASVSQRVSVLGEVANQGRYPIDSKTTVFDLIALAGGIGERGSHIVEILRPDGNGGIQRIPVDLNAFVASPTPNLSAIPTLKVGDQIYVPRGTYFIEGQIVAHGEYRLEGELTLQEAIARAGGVTPLGSASRVEVRRRGPDGRITEVKKVNKNLVIQAGDMIRVKERIF